MSSVDRPKARGPLTGVGKRTCLVAAAAAFLALGCAHAPQRSAAAIPAPPQVTLRFAWPERFTTEVLARHESETWGGDPIRALSRRVLSTTPRGTEMLVQTRAVTPQSGGAPSRDALLANALGEVVALDGTFVRAAGLDEALPLAEQGGRVAPEAARRALARSIATDWEVMVGAWAGRTFVEGEPRSKHFDGSVPLLATAESVIDAELAFEGWTPCTPEETEQRCVELHYRGRTAPSDRTATLARISEAITGIAGNPVPEDFHGHFEVTVITEPDTLVPHRIVDREALRVRLRFQDGKVRELEQRSEDEYVFAPAAKSAPPRQEPRQGEAADGSSL